jgi:hypothetical protein
MLWQLDHDFVQNETTKKVRRFMEKQAKKYFKKYNGLCNEKERKMIFEYLFPLKSVILHKLKLK